MLTLIYLIKFEVESTGLTFRNDIFALSLNVEHRYALSGVPALYYLFTMHCYIEIAE